MNPSTTGWIKKHLPYLLSHFEAHPMDEQALYKKLRTQGFIYGSSVATLCDEESEQLKWTEEEKTKINLLDALVHTYYDAIANATPQECVQSILQFYALLENKEEKGILLGLLEDSTTEKLEKLIDHRIQTNEPILKKNFSHLITNALLYMDVLAFDDYLLTNKNPKQYATELEKVATHTVWVALSRKQNKDSYNELLIRLFESSIRYNSSINNTTTRIEDVLSFLDQPLEQQYVLDLCALAIGNDQEIDTPEMQFVDELCNHLSLEKEQKEDALKAIIDFVIIHKDEISYLQYSNPVQHFYNQTSKTVSTLVLRNKTRLIKEVSQSKELAILLGQSTVRDLTKDERKLVRTQLLDICKTVPSLAIFLLPGGTILMPLLVKFIPQLLPSAFNDNKLE